MTTLRRYEDHRATETALLRAAGAHVYSQEFIQQYAQAELLKHPPGLIARRMSEASADTVKIFASAVAALAGLMAAQLTIIPFLRYAESDFLILGIKCLAAIGGFFAAYIPLDRTVCRPYSLWQTYQLEEDGTYRGFFRSSFGERRAPDFVRSLMGDIRQLLPESTFTIRVLGLDPIVTCITKHGAYPVLVYDGDRIISEE